MHEKEAQVIEARLVKEEVVKSPEKWVPSFRVLTISGPSGVGKSTIADALAKRYGIPKDRNIKIGKNLRVQTNSETARGHIKRDASVDKDLDKMQAEIIRNAISQGQPIILEGRLSGLIATEVWRGLITKTPGVELGVRTFLLTARADERHRRILLRDLKKDKELVEKYKENPEATAKKVKEDTQDREMGDRKLWKRLYPQLVQGDPFLPGNRDKHGNKIYDRVIPTTNMKEDRVLEEIHRYLKDEGLITRVS